MRRVFEMLQPFFPGHELAALEEMDQYGVSICGSSVVRILAPEAALAGKPIKDLDLFAPREHRQALLALLTGYGYYVRAIYPGYDVEEEDTRRPFSDGVVGVAKLVHPGTKRLIDLVLCDLDIDTTVRSFHSTVSQNWITSRKLHCNYSEHLRSGYAILTDPTIAGYRLSSLKYKWAHYGFPFVVGPPCDPVTQSIAFSNAGSAISHAQSATAGRAVDVWSMMVAIDSTMDMESQAALSDSLIKHLAGQNAGA